MTTHDHGEGPSRRKVLECMTWAGTGVLWTISGGVPHSLGLIDEASAAEAKGLTFLQISDSHMGFDKPANPNAKGTLEEAIAHIKAIPKKPAFMIHTGDITHLSKEQEFDDAEKIISQARLDVHYVPGEHDIIDPDIKIYKDRYGRGAKGSGYYSFDANGVHFMGLVNVANLKGGGMGSLGDGTTRMDRGRSQKQIRLDADRGVCAHPALDRLSAMGLGHRGQRARARLPEALRLGDRAQRPHPPGDAEGRRQRHLPHRALDRVPAAGARRRNVSRPDESAGRQIAQHARHRQRDLQARRQATRHHRHPAEELSAMTFVKILARGAMALLVAGVTANAVQAANVEVKIDNFTFNPKQITVKAGDTVTWFNHDDIPHTVTSKTQAFRSKAMDTDDKFSFTFATPGSYAYFCSLHPMMTGTIVVEAVGK